VFDYMSFPRITGILHKYLCTFMTVSLRIVLRMRNVSDGFVEKIKTHNLYSIPFFFLFFFLSNIVPFVR